MRPHPQGYQQIIALIDFALPAPHGVLCNADCTQHTQFSLDLSYGQLKLNRKVAEGIQRSNALLVFISVGELELRHLYQFRIGPRLMKALNRP